MIDDAWNMQGSTIDVKTPIAHRAIKSFSISGERFSESSSKRNLQNLLVHFKKIN